MERSDRGEVEALAKISYLAHGVFTIPWENVPSAEQERAEALLRARADLHRALNLAWEKVTED